MFVAVTSYQQYHHIRALASKADMLGRYCDHQRALSVVEEMRKVYNPSQHCKTITKEYGRDHCAFTISLSLLWHNYLHPRSSTDGCEDQLDDYVSTTFEYIITQIVPEIGPDEFMDLCFCFIPIMVVAKDCSQVDSARVLSLYKKYVADPILVMHRKALHITPLVRPMLIVLQSSAGGTDSLYDCQDHIDWFLDGEEKISDFLACMNYGFDMNLYTLLADTASSLAKLSDACGTGERNHRRHELVQEGLRYSSLADKMMKGDDDNIPVYLRKSHSYNSRIRDQLHGLSSPV